MTDRRPIRTTSADEPATAALKQDLVYAFHILERDGQGSGIAGHITARLPGAQSFWSHQWGQGFDDVTYEDLIEADFELGTITGQGRVNPTLHIHSRLYLARPDVTCIVHTHGINAVALGATGSNLEPFWVYGSIFHDDVALFDEYDGIVLGKAEGVRIAEALGPRRGLLLRNHGLLTADCSIRRACLDALTLEHCCKAQLMAMAAGKLKLMPEEAARQSKQFVLADETVDGNWNYLVRCLLREKPELRRDTPRRAAE
jgi:L-fuculose-phosphate aldolase